MNAILEAMSTGVLNDLVSGQLRIGTAEGQKELGRRQDAEDALNAGQMT
jgi:hypothetical protein